MRLKKIDVYGFKSFADKLCLTFNDGVTCIVGPNGCGKSNISDAIRWVLGEQRASDLRTGKGNKMDQVIFKGTNNRKAMAYCEVSLTFENEDRTLNLDADEVVITRKMYRTGESEYYINGKRDLLKNLINLFRDTGIGKDGYSVIGQGKIDSFLTAKPEDRRQIFEEAAGISKYKANRTEAMRSLDKTQINLDLKTTILRSYEEQIEPLEKQAAVAIKAAGIKSRIRDLEVNHFLYVTENSESENRKIQSKLDEAVQKLTLAKTEQEKTNVEYQAVSEKAKNLDDAINHAYEKIVELTNSAAAQDGEQKRLKDSLEEAERFIAEKTKEVEEKQKTVEADKIVMHNNTLEHQTVIHDYYEAQAEEDKLNKEYEEKNNELKNKRSKIELTNSIIIDAMSESISMTGDLAQFKAEKVNLERTVEREKETLEDNKRELGEIKKQLKTADDQIEAKKKDREEKKAGKKILDDKYNKKVALRQEAFDKFNELKDTLNQRKAWIAYQENSKANYSNYDQAVKFLMKSGDRSVTDKICGVVGDIIKVNPKYALAIEIALGNNINNMITRNQQDTSFLIDYLKKNRGGRGTFLPLTAMTPRPLESVFDDALEEDGCCGVASDLVRCDREFKPAIEVLLGRVVVVEDKDTAIYMTEKYRKAFRIVTLTGENYAISGAVTGGAVQSVASKALSLDAEIAEYKKQVDELEKTKKAVEIELNTIQTEMAELEKTFSVLENVINKLDKDISNDETKRQYVIINKERVEAEIQKLEEDIKAQENEIILKTMAIENEEQKMGTQTDKRSSANDMLAQMNDEVVDLERECREANEKRTNVINKVRTLQLREKELSVSISNLEKDIARLGAEILNAVSQIKIRTSEAEKNREKLEELILQSNGNEQLQAAKKVRDDLLLEKAEIQDKQTKLHTAIQECADRVNDFNEKKARAETQLENLQKEIEAAREKVKEEYDLDYESALSMKMDDYIDSFGQQEIKNLRKDLTKLGDVNERAVGDLKELKEKYEEEKLHYDDVVKAKEMLLATISDLTEKMESKFTESFDKIKENFATVFSEMFDGGKGRLDLDVQFGQSVLDAGIIVEAEPPGKKLQNIDLLSGGEKALTAIAIIFAIIKLNPVPFCILDEVDAPLDDSNSSVYAKYLRKFSRNTQFIIVSHRKPTMELANELYGITMQEKGVSKVLSVKLSEAMKMAEQA